MNNLVKTISQHPVVDFLYQAEYRWKVMFNAIPAYCHFDISRKTEVISKKIWYTQPKWWDFEKIPTCLYLPIGFGIQYLLRQNFGLRGKLSVAIQ